MCHLLIQPAWDEAECAVVVGDSYQKQGLGRRISSFGMELVAERGIKRITGDELPENEGMLTLAKKLGFAAIRDMGEGVYHIEHELK